MRVRVRLVVALVATAIPTWFAQQGLTQTASPDHDWPSYRRDAAGTGFSPLSEISPSNVTRLTQVWTYHLENDPSGPPPGGRGVNSQATPIVVRGVMYVPASNRIVALDPDTGRERWRHEVTGGAPSRRGVAHWPGEGSLGARILFTSGRRLIALDAATGAPSTGFGTSGEVDLVVPYNSVPLIHRHVVVVGANTPPGTPGGVGNARAYDVRTGAKLWEFSSVPQPGQVGHDTWEGDSWRGRLGANAWPFYFTVDEARNLLFIPLASPIAGAYGGDRKGANLFGNSIVAVELMTGQYRWHFQTIHHDLWDADPPAPPALFDVVRDGRTIPALGLTTKSGYLYILNRETGAPIFGVEERAVPPSDVPGEQAFATQPFPVRPPALARTSYDASDLVTADDTTAEHAKACADLVAQVGGVRNLGPFTPFGFRAPGATTPSTLVFPGTLGGANWGGIATHPPLGLIYVVTQDVGALGSIEASSRPGGLVPYEKTTPGRATFDVRIGDQVWPCQEPPWGRLTAVRASTGEIAWQIPLGVTDGLPAGKQQTGRPALAGAIATASGLLFVGSTDDNRFRAIDAQSGKELWVARLNRRGNADPITYRGASGRQYVAIVATDSLVTFAVP